MTDFSRPRIMRVGTKKAHVFKNMGSSFLN